MGDILVCAGELANLLARASSVTSTSAATNYPLANAYDGRASEEFRFASAAVDSNITADLNLITNGDFETSTLSGWIDRSLGSGNLGDEELSTVHAGAKAMKLVLATAGANNWAMRTWDKEVRAGERLTVSAWLRGNGTVYSRLRVLNLQTGKYLTSAGAWSTVQDVGARQPATYAQTSVTFTVETFAQCLGPTATLRVICLATEASNTGTVYADDVYLWPSWRLASAHGHNVGPCVTPEVRSSTDNFSGSDVLRATMALAAPTCYSYLSAVCDDRYVRLKLVGTNWQAPAIGELFVCLPLRLARHSDWGAELTWEHPDLVSETPGKEQYVSSLSAWPRRIFGLKFRFLSETQKAEALTEIFQRSRGRANPLILVPDASLGDVLLGRIDRSWTVRRTLAAHYEGNDLVVSELPFAVPAS